MDVRYEVGSGEGRVRCYGAEEALEELRRRPEEQAYDYVEHRYVAIEELEQRVQAELDAEAEYEESRSPSP